MTEEEQKKMQDLLEENLRLSKEIHEICLKTKKYLFAAQIYGIIKTFIIVIPIIIAIVLLLPIFRDFLPIIKQAASQYKDLLPISGTSSAILK